MCAYSRRAVIAPGGVNWHPQWKNGRDFWQHMAKLKCKLNANKQLKFPTAWRWLWRKPYRVGVANHTEMLTPNVRHRQRQRQPFMFGAQKCIINRQTSRTHTTHTTNTHSRGQNAATQIAFWANKLRKTHNKHSNNTNYQQKQHQHNSGNKK